LKSRATGAQVVASPYAAAVGLSIVVGVLAALVSIAAPPGVRFHEGIVVVWLCCLLFLLAGAALLYGLSVVDREPAAAWLAAAAVSTAVYTAAFGLRLYIDPDRPLPIADAVDLVMALLWLAMITQAAQSGRAAPPGGPLPLGLLTGALGTALQVVAHQAGPLVTGNVGWYGIEGALVVVGVGAVVVLHRSDQFAPNVRTALLVACALATLSRALTPQVPTSPGAATVAAATLGLLATTLFCRQTAELLAHARAQLTALVRLRAAELVAHDQQEQLHEVRAGLAALGTAARLLARDDGALSDGRRHRLASMMESEMERLGRLVEERTRARTVDRAAARDDDAPAERPRLEAVDLDEVLETVVTGRQLCGQHVEWQPVGEVVYASRDALVEALSILLVNAAEHAPGAAVTVTGRTVDAEVRIVVADDGPGIPPALRPQLFSRGARGEDSHGQGIGLSLAYRIVTSLGGQLRLAESRPSGGAAFEVVLPVRRTEVVA
jgi:two-component system OmpR family sensor kinase